LRRQSWSVVADIISLLIEALKGIVAADSNRDYL
jgi:hypothetical protein